MKESRQGQIDRLDLSTDPFGNSLSITEGAESREAYRMRVLANWNKSVENQAVWMRAGEKAMASVNIEMSPAIATKRDLQIHCKMLALYLAFDLTDEQIAEMARYADVSNVGEMRREMAKLLGLALPSAESCRPRLVVAVLVEPNRGRFRAALGSSNRQRNEPNRPHID
jgi:hypothetical protein